MKSIFASKTFWANILGGALGYLGENQGVIPAGLTPVVMAIGNVILRLLTTQPVTITGK